jgi:ankyrin repeat protein
LGADPNTRFPWVHHGVRRPALWAACCIARDRPLAGVLLEAGADPNDGVTLTLAALGGDLATLELLRAHGANVDWPWATDGATPLLAVLSWATTMTGIFWLLEHGANADAVFSPTGEAPLHRAAVRCGVDVAQALVRHGAKLDRRRADGRTPCAVAAVNGNRTVADWLAEQGADTTLPEVDRFVAACRQGDRDTVSKLLAQRADWSDDLTPQHYAAFHHAAETGDAVALEAMLAGGFDPNRPDEEIGKTVLHSAAHTGQLDAVRVLLRHGADVAAKDREFNGTPLAWAADGARNHREQDFTPVARALIDAGSPTDWQPAAEPSEDILDLLEEWRSGASPQPDGAAPTP